MATPSESSPSPATEPQPAGEGPRDQADASTGSAEVVPAVAAGAEPKTDEAGPASKPPAPPETSGPALATESDSATISAAPAEASPTPERAAASSAANAGTLRPEPEPAPTGPLNVGDRLEGTLTDLGGADVPAKLTLSDGREVSLSVEELTPEPDDDPHAPPPVAAEQGAVLAAYVVRIDPSGAVWVSRSKGSAAIQLLRNARDHNEIIEGRVASHGPSGLEVDLGGGIFALCPAGEIGDDVDNPGHLVGQTVRFRVKEASEREVLLSRRTARESITPAEAERRAEEAAEVRRRLRPGAIAPGRISRLREFGAFVDLGGGVEGLIHLSELAHERVSSPKDVVQVGQPVEVQVLKVDYDAHKGERISLSLKALSQTAWDKALTELKEGDKRKGKVQRLEPFGAFVELSPGVVGLIHVTALGGKRRHHPSDILKQGDEVEVEVLGVDKEKHRISLKRVPSEAEVAERKAEREAIREQKRAEARAKRELTHQKPHERLKPGEVVDATVDRIESYGFFLQLKGGGRGMVHVSEMGAPPEGADATKPVGEQFPKGTKLKVAVLEIDAEHRIRLSRAAVADLEGGMTAEAYLKHKAQAELEQKLLRSAERPARPPPSRRGPPPGSARAPAGASAGGLAGRTDNGRPRPAAGGPRAASPRGPRASGDGERRDRDRPPRRGEEVSLAPRLPPNKGSSMGTLGDLLKIKLQQRKP